MGYATAVTRVSLEITFGQEPITRELKQERFWYANGNRKCTDFTFNSPSHNYIHITKLIFSIRDE